MENNNDFINSIPMERRLEIDAMVKDMEKEVKELGFSNMIKDSVSLDEFTKHIDDKLKEQK